MNRKLLFSLSRAGLLLGLVVSPFLGAAERSAGTALDDASITASIKSALLADERTDGLDINVDTRNGHVTLKGGADSWDDRTAAAELARGVEGVVSVSNGIVVAPPGSGDRTEANRATASGEVRSALDETGEVIDDAWITAKVKSRLLADRDVRGMDIDVDTRVNVVHLTGAVPSARARNAAIGLARNTQGVRDVDARRLVIRTP